MKITAIPKVLIASMLLLILSSFAAPDPSISKIKAEMANIGKVYGNIASYAVDVEIKLYPTYTSTSIEENCKGFIKYSNGLYYSDLQGITILDNQRMSIIVDHDSKIIMLTPPSQNTVLKKAMPFNLDSAMRLYDKVELKEISDNINELYLEPKAGKFSKVKVQYDKRSYFLTGIILYQAEPEEDDPGTDPCRIEIKYSNISTQALPKAEFSESRFLKNTKGKYYPIGQYANYSLQNYLK